MCRTLLAQMSNHILSQNQPISKYSSLIPQSIVSPPLLHETKQKRVAKGTWMLFFFFFLVCQVFAETCSSLPRDQTQVLCIGNAES